MKVFADSSYLGNLYYPEGRFADLAQRLRQRHGLRVVFSPAVTLEFRLASLWNASKVDGWRRFLSDKEQGFCREVPVIWDALFSGFEAAVKQYGRDAKPDLLDGLHVLAARQVGATHFVSFDEHSRQRAFAHAIGLVVWPPTLPPKTPAPPASPRSSGSN